MGAYRRLLGGTLTQIYRKSTKHAIFLNLGQSMDTRSYSRTPQKMAGVPPCISCFGGSVSAGRVFLLLLPDPPPSHLPLAILASSCHNSAAPCPSLGRSRPQLDPILGQLGLILARLPACLLTCLLASHSEEQPSVQNIATPLIISSSLLNHTSDIQLKRKRNTSSCVKL